MKIQILLVVLYLTGSAYALNIVKGSNIDDVSTAMKADGYKQGGGFEIAPVKEIGSKFWRVDKGTLIVVYSKVSKKVHTLVYHLADERDHDTRKEFRFGVKSFDSKSDLLTLLIKK